MVTGTREKQSQEPQETRTDTMRGKWKELRKTYTVGKKNAGKKNQEIEKSRKYRRKLNKDRQEAVEGERQREKVRESDTHRRDRRRCREEELSSPAYFVSEKQQTVLE